MLRLSNYSFFLCFSTGLISAAKPDYISDIRPILSDKCYKCHGPDANTRKAKLRLDQRTSIPKVGSEELLHRVLSEDSDEQMPPPDSGLILSAQEKDTLQQWIEAGLPWPEDDRHWPSSHHSAQNYLRLPLTGISETQLTYLHTSNSNLRINYRQRRQTRPLYFAA